MSGPRSQNEWNRMTRLMMKVGEASTSYSPKEPDAKSTCQVSYTCKGSKPRSLDWWAIVLSTELYTLLTSVSKLLISRLKSPIFKLISGRTMDWLQSWVIVRPR